MAAIDELIEGLSAEGRVESEGEFTLDRDQARDKLRQFQLEDPRRYVLELVQAAYLKGATEIRFDIDADDMILRFDGQPFDREDFDYLYGASFSRRQEPRIRARRQLAVGLNAAMALNPRWCRVTSGTEDHGVRMEMRPGRDDVVEDGAPQEPGTRIHVKARFRPGLAVSFVRNLTGRVPEELVIQEACYYSSRPIWLDGNRVSFEGGAVLPGCSHHVALRGEGYSGMVGFRVRGPLRQESIRLVQDGVWIETHCDPNGVLDFEAVVETEGLTKDLSQGSFLRDEAYQRVIRTVRSAQGESLSMLLEANGRRPGPWLIGAMTHAVGFIEDFDQLSESEDPVVRGIARARVWKTTSQRIVSLDDCLTQIEADGHVAITTRSGPYPKLDKHEFVLLEEDADRYRLLKDLFRARLKSVNRDIERRLEQAAKREAFRSRRVRLELNSRFNLAQSQFAQGAYRGAVGVAQHGKEFDVRFVVDGCELFRKKFKVDGQWGAEAVIEGPFRPTVNYDRVHRDEATARGLCILAQALGELGAEVGRKLGGRILEQMRGFLQRFVKSLLSDNFAERLLVGFGYKESSARRWTKQFNARGPILELTPLTGNRAHPLAKVPLFRTRFGAHVSLEQIAAEAKATGTVAVVTKPHRGVTEGRLVLWPHDTERRILHAVFSDRLESWDARLENEMGRRDFMGRRTEELKFSAAMRVTARSHHEGIDVLVGIPQLQPVYDDPDDEHRVHARVLKSRRFLCKFRWIVPGGGLVATVNWDQLEPNGRWNAADDARQVAAIRRAVARGCAPLIRQIVENQHHRDPSVARYLSAVLRAVVEHWNDPGSMAQREFVENLLAADRGISRVLEEAVSFPTEANYQWLGDLRGHVSVAALRDRLERDGRVRWAPLNRIATLARHAADVVFLKKEDLSLLQSCLGPLVLHNCVGELEEAIKRHRFERRAAVTDLKIPPEMVLVADEMREGSTHGFVGLLRDLPPTPEGRIHLHQTMRPLAAVPVAGLRLVARIDDPDVDPKPGFDGVEEDAHLETLREACRDSACVLASRLVSAWAELAESTRAQAWVHARDAIAYRVARDGLPPRGDASDGLETLLNAPGLRLANGQPASVRDAQAMAATHGAVFVLMEEPIGEAPPDQELIPFVVDGGDFDLLTTLFARVEDHGEAWTVASRAWAAASLAPPVPEPPPTLIRKEIETESLHGWIALPADATLEPQLIASRDGRALARLDPMPTLPFVGVVSGPGIHFSDDLSVASLRPRAADVLRHHVMAMYRSALTWEDARPHLRRAQEAWQSQDQGAAPGGIAELHDAIAAHLGQAGETEQEHVDDEKEGEGESEFGAEPVAESAVPAETPTPAPPEPAPPGVLEAVRAHFEALRKLAPADAQFSTDGLPGPDPTSPIALQVLARREYDAVDVAFVAALHFAEVRGPDEDEEHIDFHNAQLDWLLRALESGER